MRHSNSSLTLRPISAAARCRVASVTLPSCGSSNPLIWLRLVCIHERKADHEPRAILERKKKVHEIVSMAISVLTDAVMAGPWVPNRPTLLGSLARCSNWKSGLMPICPVNPARKHQPPRKPKSNLPTLLGFDLAGRGATRGPAMPGMGGLRRFFLNVFLNPLSIGPKPASIPMTAAAATRIIQQCDGRWLAS
jgi:hypothetical protein